MSTVFILQHVHEFDDGHEDVKLIGVFSSQALARAAQQRVSDQPGFRDLPDGFVISEHHVDGEVGWREGYATFEPDQEYVLSSPIRLPTMRCRGPGIASRLQSVLG